jgi:hypothetical protein
MAANAPGDPRTRALAGAGHSGLFCVPRRADRRWAQKNPASSGGGVGKRVCPGLSAQSFFFDARVAGHPAFCWRSSASFQRRLSTFISKMIA